ncbi:hypothetical protein DSM3645_19888 [Blastopirellula marina DSM 3645]|uniref:Uncharacterized protein n=1 Tax=Blastopirellula marina DSM 3645 TaxID=314230 RepID=A3ZTM6_9BACT|nr:hypothetical protein DSM3645_19888 [Blastopirellula marina DSM 3645]
MRTFFVIVLDVLTNGGTEKGTVFFGIYPIPIALNVPGMKTMTPVLSRPLCFFQSSF